MPGCNKKPFLQTYEQQRPDHSFLYMLNRLDPKKMFGLCFLVQCLLFLPVWLYTLAIIAVALYKGLYLSLAGISAYLSGVCLLMAARFQYQLQNPGKAFRLPLLHRSNRSDRGRPYWTILIRYLLNEEKALLAGIKVFSCSILYLLLRNQDRADYDGRMPFLLYY